MPNTLVNIRMEQEKDYLRTIQTSYGKLNDLIYLLSSTEVAIEAIEPGSLPNTGWSIYVRGKMPSRISEFCSQKNNFSFVIDLTTSSKKGKAYSFAMRFGSNDIWGLPSYGVFFLRIAGVIDSTFR